MMATKDKPSKLFKRTDITISVLVSCALCVIILLCAYFLSGTNRQAISDANYEKGKMLSIIGARSMEMVLQSAVDGAILTQDDIFDSQYVPVEGTQPQQFTTKFDAYIDEACAQFQSSFFKDSSVVYARAMDSNGYVPILIDSSASDKKYGKSAGGDPMAKQILDGKRILRVVANTVEGFSQTYTSETTNEEIVEFSAPIFVNGERWGAFSVGLKSDANTGFVFPVTVLIYAALSILLSCAVVFGVVILFLKPISGLTEAAERVADGEVDRSVKIGGSNDMVTLADAIERLRVSLKLSMARMVQK
jgi:methyl-accepting chemotaxis protein